MKFSLSTLGWLTITISLGLALFISLNRPKEVVICAEQGWKRYEFGDRLFSFDDHLEHRPDMKPEDFEFVIEFAERICAELDQLREETGFSEWEIEGATYEALSGRYHGRHAYSVSLWGHGYPRKKVNDIAVLELFFISRSTVLYSRENIPLSLSRVLPAHELVHDATPAEPNRPSGGIFAP